MTKQRTKQLKRIRKQLSGLVDDLDLDKRALQAADRAGFAKRRTMLGIPLSRKHPDWGRMATYGAVAAAGAVGTRMLGNGRHDATGSVEAAAERGAERGAQAAMNGGGSNGGSGRIAQAARRAGRAAKDAAGGRNDAE